MESIINKLNGAVNDELKVLSSLSFTQTLSATATRKDIRLGAVANADVPTQTRCFDRNIVMGSATEEINDYQITLPSTGYLSIYKKDGESYPQNFTITVFPKYNLTHTVIDDTSDIDKYMVNLVDIHCSEFCKGDICHLGGAAGLQSIVFDSWLASENIYGNIASWGSLINLTTIFTKQYSNIWGDVADMCDAMHTNGRTSGTLQIKIWSKLVYLTYENSVIRIGDKYDDTPGDGGTTKTVWGYNITFGADGWELDSIINTQ